MGCSFLQGFGVQGAAVVDVAGGPLDEKVWTGNSVHESSWLCGVLIGACQSASSCRQITGHRSQAQGSPNSAGACLQAVEPSSQSCQGEKYRSMLSHDPGLASSSRMS